jgi:predicted helicase
VDYTVGGARPDVVLMHGDKKLVSGVDYKLSYNNNKTPGAKATVTVTGMKNYQGTLKDFYFTVGKADISVVGVTAYAEDVTMSAKKGFYKAKVTLTNAAGKKLAALHLNYENVEPHPSVIVENDSVAPIVQQMRFGKTNGDEDRSIIYYNDSIKIINIPLRAYDWHVNGKSPLEWIMERYAVSINKDSHIRNDPNEWCKENQQPRYILELIGRIVNVSIQTLDLIASLPPISFKNVAS